MEVMTGTTEYLGLILSAAFWTIPVLGLVNLIVKTIIRRK